MPDWEAIVAMAMLDGHKAVAKKIIQHVGQLQALRPGLGDDLALNNVLDLTVTGYVGNALKLLDAMYYRQ